MSLLGTCIVHVCLFRTESVEKEAMLRTRAMKERDEIKMAVRHYKLCASQNTISRWFTVLQGTLDTSNIYTLVRQVIVIVI